MSQIKSLLLLAAIFGVTLQYQRIQFAKSMVDGMLGASFDSKNKKIALEDPDTDVATYKTTLSDS